jgi:hypothetical protein
MQLRPAGAKMKVHISVWGINAANPSVLAASGGAHAAKNKK